MSTRNTKNWMNHPDDAKDAGVIGFLYQVEKLSIDMTKGIGLFLAQWFPDVYRKLVEWLRIAARVALRIGVRFARAATFSAVWLLIVFGPVFFFTGLVTATWMLVAVAGSVWGVQRIRRLRAAV